MKKKKKGFLVSEEFGREYLRGIRQRKKNRKRKDDLLKLVVKMQRFLSAELKRLERMIEEDLP